MEEPKGKVFVFVDFECLYNDVGFYSPNGQGWNEIGRDDPRGRIGAEWCPENPCCGEYPSQPCDDEDCLRAGKVKDLVFEGSPRHGHMNPEAKQPEERMLLKKYLVRVERRSIGSCNYDRWEIRETYSRPVAGATSGPMVCRYDNSTKGICGNCRGFEETVAEVLPHTPELEDRMRKEGKELRSAAAEEMPDLED